MEELILFSKVFIPPAYIFYLTYVVIPLVVLAISIKVLFGKRKLWNRVNKKIQIISIIIIFLISGHPYVNVFLPFAFYPPVFGKITDSLTGEGINRISVLDHAQIEGVAFLRDFKISKLGRNVTFSNKSGFYFSRPLLVIKIPLVRVKAGHLGFNAASNFDNHGEHINDPTMTNPKYLGYSIAYSRPFFGYKNIYLIPSIINNNKCDQAKYNKEGCILGNLDTTALFNNQSTSCDGLEREEERKTCVMELKRIYNPDIKKDDDCNVLDLYFNHEDPYNENHTHKIFNQCIIAKAIKLGDPDFCDSSNFISDVSAWDNNNVLFRIFDYGRNNRWFDFPNNCLTLLAVSTANCNICDRIDSILDREMCSYYCLANPSN